MFLSCCCTGQKTLVVTPEDAMHMAATAQRSSDHDPEATASANAEEQDKDADESEECAKAFEEELTEELEEPKDDEPAELAGGAREGNADVVQTAEKTSLPVSREFIAVSVVKGEDCQVGLDLDTLAPGVIQVVDVLDGVLNTYNLGAPDAKHIKPHDFILSVNKAQGTSSMLERLRQDTALELMLVRPPPPFAVTLQSYADLRGALHGATRGVSLLIVQLTGGLEAWNSANTDRAVRIYDRVVSVNGTRGPARVLLQRMSHELAALELEIIRPVPDLPAGEATRAGAEGRCPYMDVRN